MKSGRVLLGVSTIVFAASAAMTIVWCAPMASMGEMEMSGGWTMSHMWMLTPGQTWFGATASFVGMWLVMMVAMMLPSLTPTLLRYRQAIGGAHGGRLTTLVAAGYFLVWAVLGAIVFPLGVGLAGIAMGQPAVARAVPMVVGAVVLIAGVLQSTRWKARHLAFCRESPAGGGTFQPDARTAWRHGLCLGVHCIHSCASLTIVVLAMGVMDPRVMAVAAAAITAERLAPNGVRVARAIGVVGIAAGVAVIARAAGLG